MTTLDDTRHCPMLIEADRKRCGEIISELYNKTECSASLAVDAGSQLQNLLSVVDAQDGKILELERHVKVLTDALTNIMDDQHAEENRYVFLTAKHALFPPLQKESDSPETDLDEALRRQ